MATAINTPKEYPVHYRDMVTRGYRWQRVRGSDAQEVILWQHATSNEFRVTIRFQDGRLIEFEPVNKGTLTIRKPTPVPPDRMERAIATEDFLVGTGGE